MCAVAGCRARRSAACDPSGNTAARSVSVGTAAIKIGTPNDVALYDSYGYPVPLSRECPGSHGAWSRTNEPWTRNRTIDPPRVSLYNTLTQCDDATHLPAHRRHTMRPRLTECFYLCRLKSP